MRTDHPVPARCGLYYFEVKVVSSGNDGFIGATQLLLGRGRLCGHQPSCGLTREEAAAAQASKCAGIGFATADVVSNRLPGWEEHSYGYHGDDGHSFCGSGQGRKYGPTYSTGAWLSVTYGT